MLSYTKLNDDELINLIKTDKLAETELYNRYKNKVKLFVYRYKLGTNEREDLIQEGMIGLFKAIETYESDRDVLFSTYANVCIKNRIYNHLDFYIRQKKHIDNSADMDEIVSLANPENQMLSTELIDTIETIINSITDIEKKVIVRSE